MKPREDEKDDGSLPMIGKKMLLPIPNPTGNPYVRPDLSKVNDPTELRNLQVKAELNKIGVPSRSFSEYLLLDPKAAADDGQMSDCSVLGSAKRPTLNERFGRIEHAKKSLHPLSI